MAHSCQTKQLTGLNMAELPSPLHDKQLLPGKLWGTAVAALSSKPLLEASEMALTETMLNYGAGPVEIASAERLGNQCDRCDLLIHSKQRTTGAIFFSHVLLYFPVCPLPYH